VKAAGTRAVRDVCKIAVGMSRLEVSGARSASPWRTSRSLRATSSVVTTPLGITSTFSRCPAFNALMTIGVAVGSLPSCMTQTRRIDGASVFKISIRFATRSAWRLVTPVTFASGCRRFVTSPAAAGSPTSVKTIGMLFVASFAARVAAY